VIPWLLAVASAAELRLTVDDAVRLVEERNPDLRSTALRELLAQIDVQRARLDRFGATVQADLSTTAGVVKPWGEPAWDASGGQWSARADGSVILWSGGAVEAGIDRAQAAREGVAQDVAVTRRQLQRGAIDAYWNVKGIELSIAATEDALNATSQTLEIIEAKARAGLAADLDLNRSRVDLVSQQADLLSQKQRKYAAEQALAQLLAEPEATLVLVDEVPAEAPLAPPPAEAPDGAGRPELRRVEASVAQNEAEIRLARAQALPVVSLGVSAGAGGSSAGTPVTGPDLDPLRPSLDASVGLRAAWNPFDLWRTHQAIERARIGASQLEQQRTSQELEITNQIRAASSRVAMLREQAPLVKAQGDLARSNLQIVQDLYGQGNASILDLFSAQGAFRAARLRDADLRVQLALAEVELRWASGDPLSSAETSP
jgi:outer membrane protein TolC